MAGKNIEEADIGVARMAGPMFDVIVLPKGLVDVKFVVGRIRSGKVVDLDEAKTAQVQRDWLLERPAKHFRGNGDRSAMTHPEPDPRQRLLSDLARTIEQLADERQTFRDDLTAALEEGERLLKSAAA